MKPSQDAPLSFDEIMRRALIIQPDKPKKKSRPRKIRMKEGDEINLVVYSKDAQAPSTYEGQVATILETGQVSLTLFGLLTDSQTLPRPALLRLDGQTSSAEILHIDPCEEPPSHTHVVIRIVR